MAKNPRILLNRLIIVFRATCFLLAIYMTIILAARFLINRSDTSIAYRKYNHRSEDVYPSFSICFSESTEFHWYLESDLFRDLELSSMQYKRMLKGDVVFRYQYDRSLRLYRKYPPTNKSYSTTVAYHLKISDILLEAKFETENVSHLVHHKSGTRGTILSEAPFTIGFQTPDMICFTRDAPYIPGLIRLEDTISFSTTFMKNVKYENAKMSIYIHHPGQLIRSLESPYFSSLFHKYKWEDELQFKILQYTILRKRSDSTGTCNKRIQNYDEFLQKLVIQKARCVPSFWKDTSPSNSGFGNCNSQEELRNVYEEIKDVIWLQKQHDVPCIDMYSSTVWNFVAAAHSTSINQTTIRFLYKDKYYQEIEYLSDFGPESFLSNFGGFVGIFLGYSLLQLPELLGTRNISFI